MPNDAGTIEKQIADLARQACEAEPTARVELLGKAAAIAWNPLQRMELLLMIADAAGRAAHAAVADALAGRGMPDGAPATWSQIADATKLTKDTAFRQYHGGEALSWSPATRGVRQATRRDEGSRS